ncbi:MAG: DHH family phosphoesterase [Kiritimatiellia bacterium]
MSLGVDFPNAREAAKVLNRHLEELLSQTSRANVSPEKVHTLPDASLIPKGEIGTQVPPENVASFPEASGEVKGYSSITIFADYDCDGVTSAALLKLALGELGAEVNVYIPHRDEGYGLSLPTLERCLRVYPHTRLLVTVDCGVRSAEEVQWLQARGIEVIVTDHHELDENPPPCLVVNNHLPATPEAAKRLCGAGVAFKLLNALLRLRKEQNQTLFGLKNYLWLVAIATVGDSVPLRGENRLIVHTGLEQLNQTVSQHPGLQELLKQIRRNKVRLQVADIAYGIAPHLNAAGRIEDPRRAYKLLICTTAEDALLLVGELVSQNARRKQEEERCVAETVAQLKPSDQVICVCPKGCTAGIMGVIASRLCEAYQCPVVIGVKQGDGTIKASARVPEPCNAIECLNACRDELDKYGGHERAAGLTIKTGRFRQFKRAFCKVCATKASDSPTERKLQLDGYLLPSQLLDFGLKIPQLEPFGSGNPLPTVAVGGLRLEQVAPILRKGLPALDGKGVKPQHLRFQFRAHDGTIVEGIWFRAAKYHTQLQSLIGHEVEVAAKLELDHYYPNQPRARLVILDIRKKQ